MKNLRTDESGILPLLIGVALVGVAIFGGSYLLTGEDPVTLLVDFLKVSFVASMVFLLGLLMLMGKVSLLPKTVSIVLGFVCIAGSLIWFWQVA